MLKDSLLHSNLAAIKGASQIPVKSRGEWTKINALVAKGSLSKNGVNFSGACWFSILL